MVQAVVGSGPMFRHSRKVSMSTKELALVLAELTLGLNELLFPGVHAVLVVFQKTVVVVHQLGSIV